MLRQVCIAEMGLQKWYINEASQLGVYKTLLNDGTKEAQLAFLSGICYSQLGPCPHAFFPARGMPLGEERENEETDF